MAVSIENQSREQIAEFLPEAIATALNSYRDYMEKEDHNFKEKHTACKTAIAHIELLLKLARWADLPERGDADAILAAVLVEAEGELAVYLEEQESAVE